VIDTDALKTTINLLDLIGRDTVLKRAAVTNGGEYAGPCPLCNDGTDRFRVWPNADPPRFWCRICNASGDVIGYIQQRDDVSFRAGGAKPRRRPRWTTAKTGRCRTEAAIGTAAPAITDMAVTREHDSRRGRRKAPLPSG
jgi:CHC2 zinc finger